MTRKLSKKTKTEPITKATKSMGIVEMLGTSAINTPYIPGIRGIGALGKQMELITKATKSTSIVEMLGTSAINTPYTPGIRGMGALGKQMELITKATKSTSIVEMLGTSAINETISSIQGIANARGSIQRLNELITGFSSTQVGGFTNVEKTVSFVQGLANIDRTLKDKTVESLLNLQKKGYDSLEEDIILTSSEQSEIERAILDTTTEFAENLAEDSTSIIEYLNNWANKITNLESEFKSKGPFFYLICFRIIIPLICITIIPVYQDYMKNEIYYKWEVVQAPKPAQSAKNINDVLVKECNYDLSMINCVRVTNKPTPVYRGSQRSSGKIDEIKMNQPVIIIQKRKKWSLVSYNDEQGQEVTGWVLTGSLEKAKNK